MAGIVVAGGGPAGAATAAMLARRGREVLVLERESSSADKVCGDFLSIEAQEVLGELGLDLAALGPSLISSVRLVHRDQVASAALPFPALGLARRALDAALLDLAARYGAVVRQGVKVQALSPEGRTLTLGTGEELRPDAVFLATGKHELRGAARATRAPKSVGFKTYLTLAPKQREALHGTVELVLFEGGYAGLLLAGEESVNFSLVVSTDRLARSGGTWGGLLASLRSESALLRCRLAEAVQLRARPLAISRLPYGYIHRPSHTDPPRVYRVGDQAAVIPSLTGDGVSLALHTARCGVGALLAGRSATLYHAELRPALRGQMWRASLVHSLCLSATLQPAILRACRIIPAIMCLTASHTRIADPASLAPVSDKAETDLGVLLRERVGEASGA